MSDLWVFELRGVPIKQQITIGTKAIDVYAVEPHLYIHGSPAGNICASICNEADCIVAQSQPHEISSLLGGSGYRHGTHLFEIDAHLRPSGVHYLCLGTSGGYAFSENNYIGVCNTFDFGRKRESYTLKAGPSASLNIEIWSTQRINRSRT